MPICPRGHVSRFDPKVPHFSRYYPRVVRTLPDTTICNALYQDMMLFLLSVFLINCLVISNCTLPTTLFPFLSIRYLLSGLRLYMYPEYGAGASADCLVGRVHI